ncbi:Histone H4 [Trichinella pseudospiralis]|uniref:Histone H4 n=2 Tax=Trichinella pseudospiralis TaxID=6337 RepID=A0A0V1F3G0_TRIPS|nr:Histone H4 [Trichinella pseudospiralis]KRY76752.1 Histone H4 [Trichinella pseudospiralis]KRY80386.1 Histone H4 [Trichinella pseudospiralis]KRY83392.1 Histone H4 [Trichinella pseudospiralis]KRZ07448.1 Histone H4 [Trichinella pseudospiralis]
MSSRNKGGKKFEKGFEKRHHKVMRGNIHGITKSAIHRLACYCGVKQTSGLIYEETEAVLKFFLENAVGDGAT